MIRKIRIFLLGLLSAVCLQAPPNASAVDLPFVPVEESREETTNSAVDIPAEQETPVIPEIPAQNKAAETTKTSAGEKSAAPSESADSAPPASEKKGSDNDELPVLSLNDESSAETNESSRSELSLSGEKDSSDAQSTTYTASRAISETSQDRSFPIITAVLCGMAAAAGAVLFAVFRKRYTR